MGYWLISSAASSFIVDQVATLSRAPDPGRDPRSDPQDFRAFSGLTPATDGRAGKQDENGASGPKTLDFYVPRHGKSVAQWRLGESL